MFCKMITQDQLTLRTVKGGGSVVVDSLFIGDPIFSVHMYLPRGAMLWSVIAAFPGHTH